MQFLFQKMRIGPGDLRLRDNPALYWAAFKNAGPTVPIFVWCPEEDSVPTGWEASKMLQFRRCFS